MSDSTAAWDFDPEGVVKRAFTRHIKMKEVVINRLMVFIIACLRREGRLDF